MEASNATSSGGDHSSSGNEQMHSNVVYDRAEDGAGMEAYPNKPATDHHRIITTTDSILAQYENSLPRVSYMSEKTLSIKRATLSGLIFDLLHEIRVLVNKAGPDMMEAIQDKHGRQAVLQKMATAVPERVNPDFEPLKPDDKLRQLGEMTRKRVFKRACYCPHLNQEDLVNGEGMHDLIFVKYIQPNEPYNAIFSTLELAHINTRDKGPLNESKMYFMSFFKQQHRLGYGKLAHRDTIMQELSDREAHRTPATTYTIEDPAVVMSLAGIEMMQCQQYELEFIKEAFVAAELVFTETEWKRRPKKTMPVYKLETREFESLSNISAAAPYKNPKDIEFARLQKHVVAQRQEAVEHLMSLQADPAYLKTATRQLGEHLHFLLRAKQSEMTGELGNAFSLETLALFKVLSDAYGQIMWWTTLAQQIDDAHTKMQLLQQGWDDCELGAETVRVFSELDQLVATMTAQMGYNLGYAMPAVLQSVLKTDRMQAQYKNVPSKDAKTINHWTLLGAELKEDADPAVAYLHRLARMLFETERRGLHKAKNTMAALEEAIRQDATSNKYLTPWIVEKYSQLGLLAELERQVDMAQPQATMWKREPQHKAEAAVEATQANINSVAQVILEHCQEQGLDTNEGVLHGQLQSDVALDAAKDRLHLFFQPLLVKLDHTQGQIIPGNNTRPRRKIQKGASTQAFGLLGTNVEDVFEELSSTSSWWLSDRAYQFVTPTLPAAEDPIKDEEGAEPVPIAEEAESYAQDEMQAGPVHDPGEDLAILAARNNIAGAPSVHVHREATRDTAITADRPRRFQPTDTKRSKRSRNTDDRQAQQTGEALPNLRRHIVAPLPSASPTFHGKIQVDARAYRALQVMDLAPGIASGEVKFNAVLYALKQAGFMAEHASGVIWTVFRDGKSITFHRPHSAGPKWAKEQARGVGKHIASKWGFTKETFVMMEKGEVADDVEGF